jgi:hypothetical protein
MEFVEYLQRTFSGIRDEIGPLQLVIACDCVLRQLEITQKQLWPAVDQIFRRNRVVGFNTFGEQFAGVHVNQTLTGIAIGYLPREYDAS